MLPTAYGQDVRVANYNIEADINGATAPLPGTGTVLIAMGEANTTSGSTVSSAHPLDIIGLSETTSNLVTVDPIIGTLNSFYGAGTYSQLLPNGGSFQASSSGGDVADGNGPNAIIYNTTTLKLLAASGVGSPQGSSNGEYRQVARYEFQPVGGTTSQDFYVYVDHAKSGSTSQSARASEATIIRNDQNALPSGSSFPTMGDFNLNGSNETAYQTLTAPGTGQVIDPQNPTNNYTTSFSGSAYASHQTESVTDLRYRDDIQFVSANVYNGTSSALNYVLGSSRTFGNNGTTPEFGNVNSSSNTALSGLIGPISSATATSDLDSASDHYPVEADYALAPEPTEASLVLISVAALTRRRRRTRSSPK